MLFHLLTMNRHLIPLRNSGSKTDWSTPGEKNRKICFHPLAFFIVSSFTLYFSIMTWTISFMYPPLSSYSDYREILLVRWENGTLEKSVGGKKNRALASFQTKLLTGNRFQGKLLAYFICCRKDWHYFKCIWIPYAKKRPKSVLEQYKGFSWML